MPVYFLNYRNEKYFQNFHDSIPLDYLDLNLFPSHLTDYGIHFDCGTGLGLSSINPFETFKVEKSYENIIEQIYQSKEFYNTEIFNQGIENDQIGYSDKLLKNILNNKSSIANSGDSLEVEFYLVSYSFISKNQTYTKSNKIKVCIMDILNKFHQ